jgi:hypothetical protein
LLLAQVEELAAPLLRHMEAYLALHERSCTGITAAFRWVWTNHPKSLRVKELFETVDAFVLLVRQISLLQARAAATAPRATHSKIESGNGNDDNGAAAVGNSRVGDGNGKPIHRIYDLACGHGLLGVLLAIRFTDIEVVCVDLVRRDGFDHYSDAFRQTAAGASTATGSVADAANASAAGTGSVVTAGTSGSFTSTTPPPTPSSTTSPAPPEPEPEPLNNISFVEGDLADVTILPNSFVVCVYVRTCLLRAFIVGARSIGWRLTLHRPNALSTKKKGYQSATLPHYLVCVVLQTRL